MSRTYRRQHERHEYSWVLREWTFESGHLRWLADAGYEPVMNVRHRHSAKWAWW